VVVEETQMPASGSPIRSTRTLPEILSQPAAWLASQREAASAACFPSALQSLHDASELLFVGCGSSFYLAEAAASAWTLLAGKKGRALPASELLLFPDLCALDSPGLKAVIISRSGRTSEAIRAADFLKNRRKMETIGITCCSSSELAAICHATVALPSADETSMVMTRSFTSMLLALLRLACPPPSGGLLTDAFASASAAVGSRIQPLSERAESFVLQHDFADYVYLAQGPFFPIGREAALKMTEMSCSYAQAYHTLEFRHGPKSIVSPETCITFLLSETGLEAETEVLLEMKHLGGVIVAICNRASRSVRHAADFLFELEAGVPEIALLAPFLVLPQLLAFHTGLKKGFNPDEPKHLSRVVILD
jgi:glucosamine--fructose-6-phosphate aminotransferase (isomerizing)